MKLILKNIVFNKHFKYKRYNIKFLNSIVKFTLKKIFPEVLNVAPQIILKKDNDFNICKFGIKVYSQNQEDLFILNENVNILNKDFMSFNFLEFNCDCFFINDPLRNKNDFAKLIHNILKFKNNNSQIAYFILVNVDKDKRELLNGCKLIEYLQIATKGYYIYSNEK